MTALELRTEIARLLRKEDNTSVLQAIRLLLRRSETDAADDLSDAEVDELDRRVKDIQSGKVPPLDEEVFPRSVRHAAKG